MYESIDIKDKNPREIICVRLYDTPFGDDYTKLRVGEIYTLTDIVVNGWYSLIKVKEVESKIGFNSIYFDEV